MKRVFMMLLIAATVLISVAGVADAMWKNHRDTKSWRYNECRYQTIDGHYGWTDDEVRLEIWCFSKHYGVDVSRALCFSRHESGFNEYADNPYSSASGIYQVVDGTWAGWYDRFDTVRKKYEVRYNRFNPRFSAAVALKAAKKYNWSPWSNFSSYYC